MKKQVILFSISLFVFSFFACEMQIPSKIEIKGNPDIRFAAIFDIGKELGSIFGEAFDDNETLKVINCVNTPVKTFIIYSVVLDEELTLSDEIKNALTEPNSSIKLNEKIDLIKDSDEIEIPSINLDQFVKDFSFKNYKVNMYISGSDIVDILTVDLEIGDKTTSNKGRNNCNLGSAENFSGAALPNGIDITDKMKFDGNEIKITPKVYIKKDETITSNMLNDPKVKIEIAIWLPLTLVADSNKAEFLFPEDLFDQNQDLFGRASAADAGSISEFIQSLGIEIKLNGSSPFTSADLVVINEAGNITINNPISGNALKFDIDETAMKEINKNWPFAPKFKMEFQKGSELSIPKELKTSEVALKAKLSYKINLEG